MKDIEQVKIGDMGFDYNDSRVIIFEIGKINDPLSLRSMEQHDQSGWVADLSITNSDTIYAATEDGIDMESDYLVAVKFIDDEDPLFGQTAVYVYGETGVCVY